MAAATILKNRNSAISRPWFGDFDEIWHSDAVRPSDASAVENLKFQKFEMSTAAILKNRKIVVSQQWLVGSPQNLVRMRMFTPSYLSTVKNLKI